MSQENIEERVSLVEFSIKHQDEKLDKIVLSLEKLVDTINAYKDHNHRDYEYQIKKLQGDVDTIHQMFRNVLDEMKISEKTQDKLISDQNILNTSQEMRLNTIEITFREFVKTISNRTWGILLSSLGSVLIVAGTLIWYIIRKG